MSPVLKQNTIMVPASDASRGPTKVGPKIMDRLAMKPFSSEATVTSNSGKTSEANATGILEFLTLQNKNKGIINALAEARIQILSAFMIVLA